ncbi:peptide MFS transporter [Nocardioides sp. L-11A]|uniref:peptide MFS transporter n=1 Tax=Nocardioides sp. L-11A TaxID=3043848 RepID=UPI002499BF8F
MVTPVINPVERRGGQVARGLLTMAGIGMWERFSFYGTQVVLLYYLYFSADQGGLGLQPAEAVAIVGTYGALVYCFTIAGAWLSDRILGPERTVFVSAVGIMLGHLALAALPGTAGLMVGLGLLVMGTGGTISNMPSSVGLLYDADDHRRDAGFMLFYMGLNVGALGGPLLTGLLRKEQGFHVAFGAAAVGMAIGLVVYTLGRRNLSPEGRQVPNPVAAGSAVPRLLAVAALAALVVLAVASDWLTPSNLPDVTAIAVALISSAVFATMLRSPKTTAPERRQVTGLIPLYLAGAVFFALYQQQFTVVQVYVASRVDLELGGITLAPEFFNSVVPAFVIVLAPLFARWWNRQGTRQPSAPAKFLVALIGISAAFFCFLPLAGREGATISPLAILGILFLFTVAELFIAPVQLAVATRLAPAHHQTQTVGLMFLSIALGSSLGGIAGKSYSPTAETEYFLTVGLAALACAAVFAVSIPWIRRTIADDDGR